MQRNRFHYIAWGWMLLMLVLDVVFYRQRLLGDASFYLFQVVNNEKFNIEHLRPISVVSQWIPLLLTYAQAPMQWIMVSYSFNEWLYFFLLFLLLLYGLKDKGGVTALILMMIIVNKENWYNPVSELIQGGPLLIVVIAIYRKQHLKWWHYIVSLLCLGIIIQSHPLQFLLVPIMFGLLFITEERPKWSKYLIVAGFTAAMVIIRYLQFDEYEKNPDNWPPLKPENIQLGLFVEYLIKHYLGFLVVWVTVIFYAYHHLSKFKAVAVSGLVIGFTAFIVYKTGHLFMDNLEPFERYLFPLSVAVGWLFGVWVVERTERIGRWSVMGILILVLSADSMLLMTIRMRSVLAREDRMNVWMTYLHQFPEQKLVQRNDHFYTRNYGHDWTILNETALVSAYLFGGKHTQQLIPENAVDKKIIVEASEKQAVYFYSQAWLKENKAFNQHYFDFQPGKVRFLNTDSVQSHLPDSFFHAIKIEAQFPYPLWRRMNNYIPILIHNPHATPIFSGHGKEQVHLSYSWEKDGKTIIRDGERTRLAADVIGSMPQEMKIKPPDQAGHYTLVLDLVYENKKWCGINARYDVKVW